MANMMADYLRGFGPPKPQNQFILVSIRDKNGGDVSLGQPKPYLVVENVPWRIRFKTAARKGDIVELADIRHLLQFLGKNGEAFALIDRRNVGAVYHPLKNFVSIPTVSATGPYDDDDEAGDDEPTTPGPNLQVVK